MRSPTPPALAVWLLELLGPATNKEALAGDLLEDFGRGRSSAWYWRQVLVAVRWRRHLINVLLVIGYTCYVSASGGFGAKVTRPTQAAATAMALLMFVYVPYLLSNEKKQGGFFLRLAKQTGAVLLWAAAYIFSIHYWEANRYFAGALLLVVFMSKLLSRPGPQHSVNMTFRELLHGDPQAERSRLISQLERSMWQESDPVVFEAYARSLAALRKEESPKNPVDPDQASAP